MHGTVEQGGGKAIGCREDQPELLQTQRLFEWAAKFVWPVIRHFVKRSKRCSNCILSEKCSALRDGLCEECRKLREDGENCREAVEAIQGQFDETIRSCIRRGGRYHALLLLSGGKDSAYILHRLKREHPDLSILCVAVNNGFMSPLAMANARFVAEKYNTDLWVINAKTECFARALRLAFLELKGRGAYHVVDKADGDLIFEIGRQAAFDLNIPVMLAGLSWAQLYRIFGLDDFHLVRSNGLLEVYPLAAWRTPEPEIRSVVRKMKLLPPGGDSPVVSNHAFILPMSVLDVMNLGYCSFEPEFAQLVREGMADRKSWLYLFEMLEFATRKGLLARQLQQGLAKLDLSLADVAGGGA